MGAMFDDLMKGLDEVDAFLGGESAAYKVTLPAEVDVRAIRKQLNMTQARFSDTFGFSLDAVKHWEGGRRTPESAARAFLTVIAKNPKAVIVALHSAPVVRGAGRGKERLKRSVESKSGDSKRGRSKRVLVGAD